MNCSPMHQLRSGLFFFGLSLFVLWESLQVGLGTLMEPGSGFITFGTGIILSGLSLNLIWSGWRLRESRKPFPLLAVLGLAFLILYSLVLEPLGFVLATFLLMGIFFRLGQKRPWWALIGMSALATFMAYVVFGVLLRVNFPHGFLGI